VTRGASESSQWAQSHGTRGSAGALLIKEVGFGAAGHVVAPEANLGWEVGYRVAGHVAVHGCTPNSFS
jgi:hypothetical protein